MNCQCPPPDYIRIPLPHGQTETVYPHLGMQPVLHGKKATTTCDKCGVGICCNCGSWIRDYFFLCADCAKEMIE